MLQVEQPQIGPYTLVRPLGEGSTMSTYLYRYEQRKKYVVIKITRAPLETLADKEAFLARAKLLKKLKHRNIIEVLDYSMLQAGDPADDYGYLVMQYTQGSCIRERFTEGQCYPPDEVKRVLSPLADALHYAHVMHVIHGNLHPGNILQSGMNDFLLTDFSPLLAQQGSPEKSGTAAYLYRAPEHARGIATAASDQYALATMVYEWLCGRRPYQTLSQEELLFQQEHEPLLLPSSLNPRISPLIEQTLLQALAVDPAKRFPHILTFADTYLRALMGFPLPAQLSNPPTLKGPRGQLPSPASAPRPPVEQVPQTAPRETRNGTAQSSTVQPLVASTSNSHSVETPPAANHATSRTREGNKPSTSPSPEQVGEEINTVPAKPTAATMPLAIRRVLKPAEALDPGQKKIPVEPAKQSKPLFQRDEAELQRRVDTDLRQGGVLSNSLPGYEERPAQIEMATMIARSLTENTPAVIEASTGTGKSLSYLIPVVRSGKVAIVSTANKALQEQLFYKDIPFVQQHIRHFDAALVKGMGNYICLDRVEQERNGMQLYVKNPDFLRLLKRIEEDDEDFTGDIETLGFTLPTDLRSKVNADRDLCTWSKCNYYSSCYVRQMKVKAGHAKVIVVNHTLLLLDALTEGMVLPERDVIIVDEAHHLEEEATRAFTVTISQAQVTTLLAQRTLKDHTPPSLQEETKETMARTWERLYDVADPGNKGRANLREPLQEGLNLATMITKLGDALQTGRPKDLPEKEDQLYDNLLTRARNLANDIRTVFSVDQPEKRVYYVERVNTQGKRGLQQLEISAAPLEVTSWLREQLFDKSNVICTSATLATIGPDPARPEVKGPNFAYFRRRVGLDPTNYPDVQERILPLTFDYESHALLYLPRHLPEPAYGSGPAVQEYIKAVGREMLKLVEASRGRAFLLFSSKRMLDEVYEIFQLELPTHLKFPLLRQGDSTRMELVRSFRERQGAVLFGLKTFWEGVDIAGEALSLVVIDKLPFDPPDDPVHEARVAQMKAAGENWFGTYVLPQTVLRLKQGLGRLLRTHDDRGVMAILDTRLYTKGYGKQIVLALPPARRTASLNSVVQFFSVAEDDDEAPF